MVLTRVSLVLGASMVTLSLTRAMLLPSASLARREVQLLSFDNFSDYEKNSNYISEFTAVGNSVGSGITHSLTAMWFLSANPALVGNANAMRFGLDYRMQWPSLDNKYTTTRLSFDQNFKRRCPLSVSFLRETIRRTFTR